MVVRSFGLWLLWLLLTIGCEEAPAPHPLMSDEGSGSPLPDASASGDARGPSQRGARAMDAASPPVEPTRPWRPSDASPPGAAAYDAAPALDAQLAGGEGTLAPAADAESDGASADAGDAGAAGEYAVGTTRVEIVARDGRRLPLQLWYPAVEAARAEAADGHRVSEFEPEGPRRALLERLVAGAKEGCTSGRMHAAIGAAVDGRAGPFPLLVTSHHLEGIRIALFSVAEALAQHGFVVAAPDHESLTLYDRRDDLQTASLLGTVLRYNLDSLTIRARDIESVLDVLLDANAQAVPEGIRGHIDGARIGMYGHSMGAMTTGIVAARDPRIRAAAYVSAPPAQVDALNLTGAPALDALHVPGLYMLNQEDWPMNTVGNNDAIRRQFAAQRPLAYLVEVRDTGHWSFADDCALIPDFADGCGRATRSSGSSEPYDNLAGPVARQIAAHYLVEFFGSQLLGRRVEALAGQPFSAHELVRAHPADEAN